MSQIAFNVCVIVAFIIMAFSVRDSAVEVKSVQSEIKEIRLEIEDVKESVSQMQGYAENIAIWSKEW